jgi:predicted flap endonuclease-1-like 5' DNA nuclease
MITELRGASDLTVARLAEAGIYEAPQLLKRCATASQRRELATELEIAESDVLALANRADLARVRGVAGVYADLLENAGVDTVRELAIRNAANLYETLSSTNHQKQITATPPTEKQVQLWVQRAKELTPALSY